MDFANLVGRAAKKAVKRSPVPDVALARAAKQGATVDLFGFREARSFLASISPRPAPAFRQFRFDNPISHDLTVIVPVYNTGHYVGECLDSILSQEVDFDMEVIAVNDGSTDDSSDILHDKATYDPRLRVIDQQNRGFSGARNVAIDKAAGSALCFVDSDDVIAPGHLQHLWDALSEGRGDFVSGVYSRMSENGYVFGPAERTRTHGGPCSRLYRREQWSDIRFPEGFWFEDTVIGYCVKTRYSESFVSDAGYCHRVRKGSITSTHMTNNKAIDGYWVVEEMLDWCRALGIPLERTYAQSITQFGSLIYDRCAFLDDVGRRALFSACCGLIASVPEWERLYGSEKGRRSYLERALLERNYPLWLAVCSWL